MESRKQGIGTSKIICGGERLGTYFLKIKAVTHASKVIYSRAHSSIVEIQPGMIGWNEIFEDTSWFHWIGITSAISKDTTSVCLEAIQTANRLGITISCDLDCRKSLWKYGKTAHKVMSELVAGCGIVPGSKKGTEKVLGIEPEGLGAAATKDEIHATSFRSVCTQLMVHFPHARRVIVAPRGPISVDHNTQDGMPYADGRLYESRRYDITHTVGRVNGSDSLVGGLIYGLFSYPGDDQKTLDSAVTVFYLRHTIYGNFSQVTIEEVGELMSGDASGRASC